MNNEIDVEPEVLGADIGARFGMTTSAADDNTRCTRRRPCEPEPPLVNAGR